jgi:hypothetical protein
LPSSPWYTSIVPANTETNTLGQTSGVYSGNFDRFIPETYEGMKRFREATTLEYTHIPRSGNQKNAFGMDELEIRMMLAFPSRFVPNNGRTGFFYVAPATRLVWWNGPVSPNMPPSGFGTFLDLGVRPKFNESFSLNAWGRVGIFSDYKNLTSDAFRFQGRLEGIGTLTPDMQFIGGIIYYGRARVKMLPTVGVIWKPDDNWELRLVFPDPRVSRRLWRGPETDWWGYVRMDYAGGSWDIKDQKGLTDYNDIRFGVGIEFLSLSHLGGYFEFGGCFDRELYSRGQRLASLPSVFYLKTGIRF